MLSREPYQDPTISEYPGKRHTTHEHSSWTFGDSAYTPTYQITHLGIICAAGKISPDTIIDARIQIALRTCYSLMGAGLHGSNGISPVVAWSMYSMYVLPCLLYNLAVLILMSSQTAVLERFHRETLRSIQGLPDRTSSSATYLFCLRALPVEAILHSQILQLVGKIIMARDTFLQLHRCSPTGGQGYQLQVLVNHDPQVGRQVHVHPPTPTRAIDIFHLPGPMAHHGEYGN